jgi:hypothetical protein
MYVPQLLMRTLMMSLGWEESGYCQVVDLMMAMTYLDLLRNPWMKGRLKQR